MSMPMPPGKRLAIPPMHRKIPRADRIRVLELVLRRLFGEAYDLACDLEENRLRALKKKKEQAPPDVQAAYTDAKARLDGWLEPAA